MRGEQEKICFEQIKEWAIERADIRLLRYWDIAIENSDDSAFPEFVFPNGFIEHFQVSTANETKKGSKHSIAESGFERESDMALEQEKEDFLQSSPRKNASIDTYGMQVITHEMVSPDYSYNSFVDSFKRNFDKHIKSLQKYTGKKSIGIFLVELVGAQVTIMQDGRFKEFYRLSIDKNLLDYINEYAEYLRYIVFTSSEDYELLDIQSIPTILQKIPANMTFGVGRYINIKQNIFIDF